MAKLHRQPKGRTIGASYIGPEIERELHQIDATAGPSMARRCRGNHLWKVISYSTLTGREIERCESCGELRTGGNGGNGGRVLELLDLSRKKTKRRYGGLGRPRKIFQREEIEAMNEVNNQKKEKGVCQRSDAELAGLIAKEREETEAAIRTDDPFKKINKVPGKLVSNKKPPVKEQSRKAKALPASRGSNGDNPESAAQRAAQLAASSQRDLSHAETLSYPELQTKLMEAYPEAGSALPQPPEVPELADESGEALTPFSRCSGYLRASLTSLSVQGALREAEEKLEAMQRTIERREDRSRQNMLVENLKAEKVEARNGRWESWRILCEDPGGSRTYWEAWKRKVDQSKTTLAQSRRKMRQSLHRAESMRESTKKFEHELQRIERRADELQRYGGFVGLGREIATALECGQKDGHPIDVEHMFLIDPERARHWRPNQDTLILN